MNTIVSGTLYGDTIKLDKPLDMAEGQKLEIVVRAVSDLSNWGEGLRRCAGMLADESHLDEVLEEIYRDRKRSSFREVDE